MRLYNRYDSNPPTSSDSDDEDASDKGSDEDSGAEKKVKPKKPKEVKKSRSAKTVVCFTFILADFPYLLILAGDSCFHILLRFIFFLIL